MKYWLSILFLIIFNYSNITGQQNSSITLLGHLDQKHGEINGNFYSDCWGYTAPDGKEYGLLATVDGTAIIDVSNPLNPYEVDFVPAAKHNNRDIKTYSHYAYVVSERNIGMQIIDLSFLPDSVHLIKEWVYDGFSRSHSIFQEGKFLYLTGGNVTKYGGIAILSLDDPVNPIKVGEWDEHYVHDLYIRDDIIYAASMENGVDIIDVSDKTLPHRISGITYENSGTHNTWLTNDGNYLLTTDEINHQLKDVKIWDIRDLNNITQIAEYLEDSDAVVHNVYVRDNYAHLAYYAKGYIVVDITDPTNPIKIGGYDTYPGNESPFGGVWGLYPFFPSGNIIASDRQTGLYIFSFTPPIIYHPVRVDSYQLHQNYPNPFNQTTIIRYDIPQVAYVSLRIYNIRGQLIDILVDEFQNSGTYLVRFRDQELASGIYFYELRVENQIRRKKMMVIK